MNLVVGGVFVTLTAVGQYQMIMKAFWMDQVLGQLVQCLLKISVCVINS